MVFQAPLWERDGGGVWEEFQLKINSEFLQGRVGLLIYKIYCAGEVRTFGPGLLKSHGGSEILTKYRRVQGDRQERAGAFTQTEKS